jgi:hypothetical protein
MGNKQSRRPTDRFMLADVDYDDRVDMQEFEQLHVKETGQRPGWQDWRWFMDADVGRKYYLTQEEFWKTPRVCSHGR